MLSIYRVKRSCLHYIEYLESNHVFGLFYEMSFEKEKELVDNFIHDILFKENVIGINLYLEALKWNQDRDLFLSQDKEYNW